MAVAVYISNERGSTEIAIDNRSTQEIVIVGGPRNGSVPVKIVSRTISGVKIVKIVGNRSVVSGETL